MNLIPLKSLELKEGRRGPGPRNQTDVTANFTTHKVKPGDTVATETGLTLLWDRAARVVYIVRPDTQQDPCVIVGVEDVARMLPVTYDWLKKDK